MDERQETPHTDRRRVALLSFVDRVASVHHDNSELDAAAAEAITALEENRVQAILLKGRGLDLLLYEGSGGQRRYSDIDLLVAPDQLSAAAATLGRLGYANADAVQGVDEEAGAIQAHTWTRSGRGGLGRRGLEQEMIDLHWNLPGAGAAPSQVWGVLTGATTRIETGGRQVAVLDRPGQALHLAMHAAQHGATFDNHQHELSLALTRWPHETWRSAALLAERILAVEAFAAGLRLVPEGSVLAERLGLPATAELDWRIRHRGEEPRGAFYVRTLSESKDLRDRLRVLRRVVFPKREWIEYEFSWTRDGGVRLMAGYAVHLMRAPVWGARAWAYLRRGRRAAGG